MYTQTEYIHVVWPLKISMVKLTKCDLDPQMKVTQGHVHSLCSCFQHNPIGTP